MHVHPAHGTEGVKAFLNGLFATFVGLLMALALENWHQNHRATALANAQLQQVKQELRANLESLQRLELELRPVIENYAKVEAYLNATPQARKGMPKPMSDGREFNFVWSTWDGAVAMGIQKHLSPEQNRNLGATYATFRRLQTIQDAALPADAHLRWAWQEDWSLMSSQEYRALKHRTQSFMQWNRTRARFASSLAKEIEGLLQLL